MFSELLQFSETADLENRAWRDLVLETRLSDQDWKDHMLEERQKDSEVH